MKIKYPKKQGDSLVHLKNNLLKAGGVLIIFAAGMLFYRSGYPSLFLARIRDVPITDESIPESPIDFEEIQKELDAEIGLYEANGLATIFLDIPFESMEEIKAKRAEALDVGVLLSEDDDYVPGNIRYNDGESMDMDIRLKGDWTDHLRGDKWSFRVHIKDGEGSLLGMRRFSLQAPETRNFVNAWAYHQNLFLEGILTTRYHFVNVVINGEHKGIYALEESFSEDLLESQGRREGVIIRFDEDFMWNNWARFKKDDLFDRTSREVGIFLLTQGAESSEITSFRSSRIADNDVLTAEAATAIELLYGLRDGAVSHSEALDEELWGKYYAITDFWGAGHGTAWHNERLYYNPVTGLLEPIAFDGDVFSDAFSEGETLAQVFDSSLFFQSPQVQKSYLETLDEVIAPEYRTMLEEKIGDELEDYTERIVQEYERNQQHITGLELPWNHLEIRAKMLALNLDPYQPLRGNYAIIEDAGQYFLKVDLVNLMVLPISVEYISIGDEQLTVKQEQCQTDACEEKILVDDNKVVLLSARQNGFDPISFRIPISAANAERWADAEVAAVVRFFGSTRTFVVPIYDNYVPVGIVSGVKPTASLEEVLVAHPFLLDTGEGELIVEPGEWDVEGDLIIPPGYSLSIYDGTTLRFGLGNVLLTEGALNIYGSEIAPVYLTAQETSWGGAVILNAPEESRWDYAIVEKTGGIARDGWILTGGITFYESPLQLIRSVFRDNQTEDALNIIRADFSFDGVEFANAPSDAFDGDFVTGTITSSSFHDIAGDAVDVSGSDITVQDSYLVRIGDKAVSAGEKSIVDVQNLTIRDVSIGIASKDLSEVTANACTIDSARVVGLTAYIKKDQYGPATINANGITLTNTETATICQLGSQVVLNGTQCTGVDVDVDALYDQGILGN